MECVHAGTVAPMRLILHPVFDFSETLAGRALLGAQARNRTHDGTRSDDNVLSIYVFGLAVSVGYFHAAIAGEFASDQAQGSAPNIITLDDGSMLVSGAMSADAMAEALDIDLAVDRDYATAAGHVLHVLRHLPQEGESFVDQGWHFEVVDMDGRKIDKLRVHLAKKAPRINAVADL